MKKLAEEILAGRHFFVAQVNGSFSIKVVSLEDAEALAAAYLAAEQKVENLEKILWPPMIGTDV